MSNKYFKALNKIIKFLKQTHKIINAIQKPHKLSSLSISTHIKLMLSSTHFLLPLIHLFKCGKQTNLRKASTLMNATEHLLLVRYQVDLIRFSFRDFGNIHCERRKLVKSFCRRYLSSRFHQTPEAVQFSDDHHLMIKMKLCE